METVRLVFAVVVLALVVYFMWGFWLGFAALTIVYALLAAIIVYVIARYYGHGVNEYWEDNNTLFFVLLGATAVTFVIACFNFGPAILLPENLPTPEQRGWLANFANHLWLGKHAPAVTVPTDPLPWTTGTWFWWKATGVFALLTFGYFWFAFWDEATHAIHFVADLIRQRLAHRAGGPAAGAAGRTQQAAGDEHHHGWEVFTFAFLAEIIGSFLMEFWEHRRRRANGA
jgi:hypothetical protein